MIIFNLLFGVDSFPRVRRIFHNFANKMYYSYSNIIFVIKDKSM